MRKKRIVAMALAMSIFASTFGMLGAAAADAEPIEDTTGGSITVTVVPLDSAGDTEGEEPKTTETGDEAKDTDTEPGTPAEGEDGDTSTDTDADKEPDYSQIERPTQSDTVETLPGDAEDNKDHIKGEDKADSKDDASEPETPAEGEDTTETPAEGDDKGTTETPAEGDDKDATETPAEGDKDTETEPEEPAEDDDINYDVAYDEDTGHFKVTFNIKEGAEGDQTIELSKVNEAIQKFGASEFDKWLATESGQKWYKKNESWIGYDKVEKTIQVNGLVYTAKYTLDENGNIQRRVSLNPQPGDTTTIDVSLTNGSKHTYVYKNGSLTVTTDKLPKTDNPNAPIGFDGQPLPDNVSKTTVDISYSRDPSVHGCMEDLIDQLGIDRQWSSPSKVQRALDAYINEHYKGDYDTYILDYYNTKDKTSYTSVDELLTSNSVALRDLNKSGAGQSLHRITFDSPTYYNYFYKNVLGLNFDDPDKLEAFKKAAGVSWKNNGNDYSIGDYMLDKLNATDGAWDKANSYFNALLSYGLSEDEATWAAFAIAVNLDGELGNNNIQDKPLSWYASMVLHQADGTLDLTKVDKDGNVIGDEEGEGQTSFYLWKYETDKKTGETSTLYYTNVPDEVDENGNVTKPGFTGWAKYDPDKKNMTYTITTTDGKLNIDYALLENMVYYLQEAAAPDGYDIDTTVYVICDEDTYNQLKESGQTITNVAAGTTSSAADLGYKGKIEGGKTLTVQFVNSKTITPDPDPDPDPVPPPVPPVNPVDPENPDVPVDPENPDLSPVQDATPDAEAPVLPENPSNPAVQNARADVLPQTGTTSWMAGVLMGLGSMLMACGWFFTRKQHAPKH